MKRLLFLILPLLVLLLVSCPTPVNADGSGDTSGGDQTTDSGDTNDGDGTNDAGGTDDGTPLEPVVASTTVDEPIVVTELGPVVPRTPAAQDQDPDTGEQTTTYAAAYAVLITGSLSGSTTNAAALVVDYTGDGTAEFPLAGGGTKTLDADWFGHGLGLGIGPDLSVGESHNRVYSGVDSPPADDWRTYSPVDYLGRTISDSSRSYLVLNAPNLSAREEGSDGELVVEYNLADPEPGLFLIGLAPGQEIEVYFAELDPAGSDASMTRVGDSVSYTAPADLDGSGYTRANFSPGPDQIDPLIPTQHHVGYYEHHGALLGGIGHWNVLDDRYRVGAPNLFSGVPLWTEEALNFSLAAAELTHISSRGHLTHGNRTLVIPDSADDGFLYTHSKDSGVADIQLVRVRDLPGLGTNKNAAGAWLGSGGDTVWIGADGRAEARHYKHDPNYRRVYRFVLNEALQTIRFPVYDVTNGYEYYNQELSFDFDTASDVLELDPDTDGAGISTPAHGTYVRVPVTAATAEVDVVLIGGGHDYALADLTFEVDGAAGQNVSHSYDAGSGKLSVSGTSVGDVLIIRPFVGGNPLRLPGYRVPVDRAQISTVLHLPSVAYSFEVDFKQQLPYIFDDTEYGTLVTVVVTNPTDNATPAATMTLSGMPSLILGTTSASVPALEPGASHSVGVVAGGNATLADVSTETLEVVVTDNDGLTWNYSMNADVFPATTRRHLSINLKRPGESQGATHTVTLVDADSLVYRQDDWRFGSVSVSTLAMPIYVVLGHDALRGELRYDAAYTTTAKTSGDAFFANVDDTGRVVTEGMTDTPYANATAVPLDGAVQYGYITDGDVDILVLSE